MKIKSFFLTASLLLLLPFCAIAQDQHLGIEIGYNRPVLRESVSWDGGKLTTPFNGARVGLMYEATLIKGFGVRLGVEYDISSRTGKWQNASSFTTYPQTRKQLRMQNIGIPVEWQYKFQIAKETYLVLYTGPTFAYHLQLSGITMQKSYDQKVTNQSVSLVRQDVDNDDVYDYSQFNLQWGMGAAFQFQNYYVRGGYDFGIINAYRDRYNNLTDAATKARCDGWHITAGIYFLNF